MKRDEVERLMRAIMAQGHEMNYLPQTQAELIAHHVIGSAERVLGAVKVVPLDRAKAEGCVYVCTVITVGEMLTLPDNKTAPCAWGCGRTVQFRPWAPPELPRVCLYCMSERKKDDN